MQLEFDKAFCRMEKISNNLLKCGEDDVTEFTIPIVGLMLNADQLNELMGDAITHRSWFNQRKDVWEPCDWWGHANGSFPIEDKYEALALTMHLSGEREVAIEGYKAKTKDEEDIPACKLSKIRLAPHVGGLTEMEFHLHVRPGIGKDNLLLQEHQNREIRITLSDSKISRKKDTQQQLDLGPPTGAMMGQPVSGAPTQDAARSNGNALHTAAAQGQDEPRTLGSDDSKPEQIHDRVTSGGADPEPSGSAPAAESTGEPGTMGEAGWPPPEGDGKPMTPEEQAEFERAAERQVAAYNAKPGHVVDGTTARSRKRRDQPGAH